MYEERSERIESVGALGGNAGLALTDAPFWQPHYLDPQSAWIQHVPFAFWVVEAFRPACLVELGTHTGVSYLAFCQAVLKQSLTTRCYAIDTWKGDEHSGFYGEEVFQKLSQVHDAGYAAFSRLVRSTFDEAAAHFADASIDLLHIDGLHTFEAVEHDYERWRPKLASTALVLFHDTNVRERGFGVFELWRRLAERYPHFEFMHGHGLGVLGVGGPFPEPVAALFAADREPAATARIRQIFAELGAQVVRSLEIQQLRAELARAASEHAAELAMAASGHAAELAMAASGHAAELARAASEHAAELARAASEHAAELAMAASGHAAELAIRDVRLAALRTALAREREETQRLAGELSGRGEILQREVLAQSRRAEELRGAILQVSDAVAKARKRTLARRLKRSFKETRRGVRRRLKKLKRAFKPRKTVHVPLVPAEGKRQIQTYAEWIRRYDQLTPDDRQAILRHVTAGTLPSVLVLSFFPATSQDRAGALLQDLRKQLFADWNAVLCFSADCAEQAVSRARGLAEGDRRCRIVRWLGEAGALEDLAQSEMRLRVLVVAPGIRLREHALYAFAAIAEQEPGARLIYADEDSLGADGQRHSPWFKPKFSPELAARTAYLGGCALVAEADLALLIDRLASAGDVASYLGERALQLRLAQIVHIPYVLYHADRGACIQGARVDRAPTEPGPERLPSVSIIIPTRDRRDLLEPCIRSIEEKTLYPRSKLEILIVDGGSSDPGTLQYLSEVVRAERSRLIRDGLPFNYSRINNLAAAQSNNEVLIFLNNDTLINDKHWIDRLVGFAVQKDVGAVGAKLLYPDHTVQHGGVVIGVQGVAAHAHVGLRETDGGYQNLANISHEVSAVTGACLAIRRSVFEEVGGFDEALAVAFNDVKLCLDVLARGYRNVYVAEPIVFHLESKTRGFDDTAEKIAIFHREAAYTRSHHDAIFKEDPYYSPNLSLEQTYDLAWPPRRGKPWRTFASRRDASLRVLMLSSTYEIGHGVAVVLNLQAAFLARHGFEVFIGGPARRNEFGHEGCRRAVLDAPREAASFAVENDIDCIVAHTPPFFSTVRWLGARPRSILYDYGEPNPKYFPNAEERRAVLTEKCFCYEMADKVYTISRAVQQEAGSARADILPLANSHLARWDEDAAARRKSTRAELVLEDKIIVLNVCRFHEEERRYKGIDTYVAVLRDLELQPHWRDKLVFVLCGKATEEDVSAMKAEGLRVFANVSDERLTDLYSAADVYMNFSRWEGYNLGIGQALAFGLPVIASNIPAHREFPIATCDTVEEAVARFAELVEGRPAGDWDNLRTPVISSWDGPLTKLAEIITNVCAEARSA